jgi:hypothetical protein
VTGNTRLFVLPVGAWALIERIQHSRGPASLSSELTDLHRLLAEYPNVGLVASASPVV